MKKNQIILPVIILFFLSCEQNKTEKIGYCYIVENKTIKYLNKSASGIVDTIRLEGANTNFFEIILETEDNKTCTNDVWAKDKLSVWYKYHKINGADPLTFKVLKDSYSKDSNHVFYKQTLLVNAEKEHFEILNNFFAKDNHSIWYKGKEVFGIENPEKFSVIDGYFSSDGKNMYLNNDTIFLKIPDSDPNTFENIKHDMHLSSLKYYRDKKNVYCIDTEKTIGDENFMYVFDAFTESFEILREKHYSKDNFNVYFKNKIIENSDRLTFTPLGNNYAKDKNTIYFKNKVFHSVDYKTFIVLHEDNEADAKDSLNYFRKGKKIFQK